MEWTQAAQLPIEGDEGASDDVLVQLSDGTMEVAYWDYAEDKWLDRYGQAVESEYAQVAHWRPLPEGPKK